MGEVLARICQSVARLTAHQGFQTWLASERPNTGDYLLINNSFVFRDLKSVKSNRYLCLVVGENRAPEAEPRIATDVRFNTDFKRFSVRSQNLPSLTNLDTAVQEEMGAIGQLLFLLIGRVQDRVVLTETIQHEAFPSISWDPSLGSQVRISEGLIGIGEVHDEEAIWEAVEGYLRSNQQDIPSGLHEAIGIALDRLQSQAVAYVEIPAFGTRPTDGITDAIVQVLREQRDRYKQVLSQYAHGQDPAALNEILRIAYNFASDATGYIRLIVSVCDLKPIVLWGTIFEQYSLSETFRHLPWNRSRNKPSLGNYELIISDARNSAFHNLFPFRKTLHVPLSDAALRGVELRIFSEHARKKDNRLTYQDKELVDVLTEFTRARERRVSDHFWRQNLQVMDATTALFSRTSGFLKALHTEIGARRRSGRLVG